MGRYLELARNVVGRLDTSRSRRIDQSSSEEARKHSPAEPSECAHEKNEVIERDSETAKCARTVGNETSEVNEETRAPRRSAATVDERYEVGERSRKTAATGNTTHEKKYEERPISHSHCPASEIPAKLLPPVRSRSPYVRQLPVVAPEFFEQLRAQRESYEKALQRKQRRPRKRRPTDPKDYTTPFGAWLAAKWRDPGPVGDLVSAFRQEPDESYPEQWQERLDAVQAHKGHHAALKAAVSRWKEECKKGSSSDRVGRKQRATRT